MANSVDPNQTAHSGAVRSNYILFAYSILPILFWPKICFFYMLFLKTLSGMANSVDPDQERSDLGMYCLFMPFCQKL